MASRSNTPPSAITDWTIDAMAYLAERWLLRCESVADIAQTEELSSGQVRRLVHEWAQRRNPQLYWDLKPRRDANPRVQDLRRHYPQFAPERFSLWIS